MASLKEWSSNTSIVSAGTINDVSRVPLFCAAQPYVVRRRTSLPFLIGTAVSEPPLTLRFLVQEEGVDFPFYTRGVQPYNPPTARRRSRSVYDVVPYSTGILEAAGGTMPFPLTTAPTWDLGWWLRRMIWTRVAREADLPSHIPPPLDATTYSTTLCELLSEVQRHLLEPVVDGGFTWQLWTRDEVVAVVQRRVTAFVQMTGIIRERVEVVLGTGPIYDLPSHTLQVRRVGWTDGATQTTLEPTDQWALSKSNPGWEDDVADEPQLYELVEPNKIRLYPQMSFEGSTLRLIIVPHPETLSGCSNLPIPTIFCWALKWGVIADLLRKEGEANDPERAKYAEGRYEEGVELARLLLGSEV